MKTIHPVPGICSVIVYDEIEKSYEAIQFSSPAAVREIIQGLEDMILLLESRPVFHVIGPSPS